MQGDHRVTQSSTIALAGMEAVGLYDLTGFGKLKSEQAFALPSVLFLITILSLVAAGVISLVFVQHQQALREVARVKAEYAAQSGIAMMLAQSGPTNQSFSFDDGSEAHVEVEPWGVFQVVRSDGKFRRSQSKRIALAALHPPGPFQHALVFGNASHQLVFAGTASVAGNVVVGQPGVTTGSLRNTRTPPRVPITGSITKEASPSIPQFQIAQIEAEISCCRALLNGATVIGLALSSESNESLQLDLISDSTESVRLQGNVTIAGNILRRDRPVRIGVNGRVLLRSGASLRGLVSLFATREIIVSGGVTIEHAILMSGRSIELEPGSTILGQVLSPLVKVDNGAVAKYPSAIISFPVDSVGERQKIEILGGAHVEGLVALVGTSPSSPQDNIVEIQPRAVIIGAAYSENRMTLDGIVIGTVFTKDFYFYEAPTQYLGWVRNGVIDRSALAPGFLVPAQFSGASQMDVLDWL